MQVHFNNFNNVNFNGTLKIYDSSSQYSKMSKESVKMIEKQFSYATKDENGHMDVLLYDRYNVRKAKPDIIIFSDGNYNDYAETFIKNRNDDFTILNKFISIFNEFKNIKNIKDKVKTTFK